MKVNIIAALLLAAGILACQREQTATTGNQAPASERGVTTATHRGVGIVEEVNLEKRAVKINHEAIKGYMEAMSMEFRTRNPALLNDLKPGDRIEFTLEVTAGIVVVTDIKKL